MQNLSQDQIKHDSGTFTWPVPGHPLSTEGGHCYQSKRDI